MERDVNRNGWFSKTGRPNLYIVNHSVHFRVFPTKTSSARVRRGAIKRIPYTWIRTQNNSEGPREREWEREREQKERDKGEMERKWRGEVIHPWIRTVQTCVHKYFLVRVCVYGYLKQRKLAISKMVVANYPRSNASPLNREIILFYCLCWRKQMWRKFGIL